MQIKGIFGKVLSYFRKERYPEYLDHETVSNKFLSEESVSEYCINDLKREIFDKAVLLMERDELYLTPSYSIEDLSRDVGTNRTYMSESIRDYGSNSYCDFVNNFRVERVMRRINEEVFKGKKMLPVQELAIIGGFGCTRVMNRHFRRYIGKTPGIYRRELISEKCISDSGNSKDPHQQGPLV